MEPDADSIISGGSRTPGRQSSRRQALPRRSTRGPLETDVEDDPLSVSTTSVTAEEEHETKIQEDETPVLASAPAPTAAPVTKPLPNPPASALPLPEARASIVDRPSKNLSFLLKPTNFLPLNNQDIPLPFQQPLPTTPLSALLSTGHFRHAALQSATLLQTEPSPTNTTRIFSLLHVRLLSLQLLGLETQAAQESKCLQDLNAPFYRDENGDHIVPWDLRVLAVRLQSIGYGDWRRGIMAYFEMARECRVEARKVKAEGLREERKVWEGRLTDLGMRVCNALIEIGDLDGAVRHLRMLRRERGSDERLVRLRLAFTFLQGGDVETARRCIEEGFAKSGDEKGAAVHEMGLGEQIIQALCVMAEGRYDEAIELWQSMSESRISAEDRAVAVQNMALCYVYIGEVAKAQELLEGLIDRHTSVGGVTFNLATVYELCSDKSREMKVRLAERVAAMEGTSLGWDRANADFKL